MTETSLPTIPEILTFNPHELANDTEKLVRVLITAQEHLRFLAEEMEAITQSANEAKKSTNLIDELVYTYAVAYINSEEFSKQIEETVKVYVENYLERLDYSELIDRDYIGDSVTSIVEETIEDITLDIRIR